MGAGRAGGCLSWGGGRTRAGGMGGRRGRRGHFEKEPDSKCFVRVRQDVFNQVTGPREGLAARLTDVRPLRRAASETCGLSSAWVRFCLAIWLECEKALPHVSQTCGFSPVWVSMCMARVGGGVRIHPENARLSGRHGVQ